MRPSVAGGRMIAAKINSDGTVSECIGGEVRCVRTGAGAYVVYFPAGFFSAPPIFVANCGETLVGGVARPTSAPTAQSVPVATFVSNTGTSTDSAFYFTAIGRG